MSALAQDTVLGRINALLAEIDGPSKSASELDTTGSAAKDPGGYQTPSAHPSAKIDGHNGPASLGTRAKENEKDVKNANPAQVDNKKPGEGGSQDEYQYNIGTNQSATGEDSKTEKNFKDRKEDPGTEHPANAEDIGAKYASLNPDELHKEAYTQLNTLLAALANKEPIETETTKKAGSAPVPTLAADPGQAARQGYEFSSQLLAQEPAFDKTAFAHAVLEGLIKEALTDAANVARYLYERAALAEQQAQEQKTKIAAELPPEAMAAVGGGGPPAGTPAEAPPAPVAPVGAPSGVASAPGESHEQAMEELINALIEMGIPPEEILAAAQQSGAGGVMGGMGEGLPKTASTQSPRVVEMARNMVQYPEDTQALYKLASEVIQLRDQGKLKVKSARQGTKLRAERDEIKKYIRDVCGVS